MNILYILPNETVKTGGNWITATRLARGLRQRGISVDIIEARDASVEKLRDYDVIHVFHVFKSLMKIRDIIKKIDKIIIISFTGTDLQQLKEMSYGKSEVVEWLNDLEKIIVFHSSDREELLREGIDKGKIVVIAQAPMPVGEDVDEDTAFIKSLKLRGDESVVFLFASGIRRVKAPLQMIDMMSNLRKKMKGIELIIVGPILESDLGEKLLEEIRDKDWIRYLGEVSHRGVQRLLSESDVVINTSLSEGMSNTLLEAQQLKKPILARDVSGNRSVVTHGVDGFLFESLEEFVEFGLRLSIDSNLRHEMGEKGYEKRSRYDWLEEVNLYGRVYEESKL